MNMMSSVVPIQAQSLTLSKFPIATTTINPSTLTNSNMLVSQRMGVKRLMDPEAATQLQAPGQPFIGAQPKPETKVLL